MLRIGIALAGLAAAWTLSAPAGDAAVLTGWTQYAAGGIVEARIVTDDASCPSLTADGAAIPMRERLTPSTAFPGHVCVAPVPAGTQKLSAGDHPLPVPVDHPHHIVVIGDTGCRLKGPIVQSCNDENAWPFLKVAVHAAAEHPDLVIHVGDFLYRETPCLPADSRCAGTPWGDNWPTWNADFFAPAAKLLNSATWVIERGNHEDCHRAGTGWTTYLGRDPVTLACEPRDKPMLVDIGGVTLAVLDENDANENEVKTEIAASLKQDIAVIMAAKPNWIITHHPFRGVSKAPKTPDSKEVAGGNATMLAALQGTDESALTLMLSGHIHNFQIENFASPLPPQLVVGEGGDLLDGNVPPILTGLITGGQTITSGMSLPGFGYIVMDRVGDGQDWTIAVHSADGPVLRQCALTARVLSCHA